MNTEIEPGTAGPLFEDFLKEQGTYETTTEQAVKRVLAFQLKALMKEQHVSRTEMAKRLDTSRHQLDRLFDPDDDGVTLSVLARAARAVGHTIRLELV